MKYFKEVGRGAKAAGKYLPGMAFVGTATAAASHPFEHAQAGRQGLPKHVRVRNQDGSYSKYKNPARYGKIKVPGTDKGVTYDRGSYWQHMAARVPKGVVTTSALLGSIALAKKLKIPTLK